MRHVVRAPDQELRLDRWLRLQFPFLPQSFWQSQLRKRQIRLQSAASHFEATRANSVLREGSIVAIDARLFQSKLLHSMKADAQTEFRLEATRRNETMGTSGDAKRLRERVVYQDAHFVVLDKPQGLAVQVERREQQQLLERSCSLAVEEIVVEREGRQGHDMSCVSSRAAVVVVVGCCRAARR